MDLQDGTAHDREDDGAAFQVIVLGGGGGPGENDTTGLLVRSTATEWGKNSVMAVDAGVHLSAIEDIFKKHLPDSVKTNPPSKRSSRLATKLALPVQPNDPSKPRFYPPVSETRGVSRAPSPVGNSTPKQMNVMTTGPFKDLMVPYETSEAISAYFLRNLVSTILITHPHLDHLSGFAINTAALQNTTKPKKLVGLPATIEAIKTHVFNDVIWPNMSDEEGGIGFVSYQRLSDGGHSLLGEHEAAGYIEVCDNLAVKAYTVSHGNCMKRHKHRGSTGVEPMSPREVRRLSGRFGSVSGSIGASSSHNEHHGSSRWANGEVQPNGSGWGNQRCTVDSSAFFIRDDETAHEILIFGDVEPDRVSMEPRNYIVWAEAAPKVARKSLTTIFIECSYDDSQADPVLFGHLAPRHLVSELAMLAAKVTAFHRGIYNYTEATPKEPSDSPNGFQAMVSTSAPPSMLRRGSLPMPEMPSKKRTHQSALRGNSVPRESVGPTKNRRDLNISVAGATPTKKRTMISRPLPDRVSSGVSPLSSPTTAEPSQSMDETVHASSDGTVAAWPGSRREENNDSGNGSSSFPGALADKVDIEMPEEQGLPLSGVKVVVIHVKDPLRDDWNAREVILRQLQEHEREWKLGCEFHVCNRGDSIWA